MKKILQIHSDQAHAFQYFSCKLTIIIAITAVILDFLKILNMGFCCSSLGKIHAENEKDLPHRFRPAHAFQCFSWKLMIIMAIMAAILYFLKILNIGFCCTIIGMSHEEN